MTTQILHKPQIPHEQYTFIGGETCDISWEQENGEWIVSCRPKLADGPEWGVGWTKEAALADLEKHYAELIDFATGD
jgi:hypothetical protein